MKELWGHLSTELVANVKVSHSMIASEHNVSDTLCFFCGEVA